MKILLLISVFFSSMVVIAQVRVTGIVQDEAGTAIPGANIMIEGSYDGTTSDTSGKFYFTTEASGPLTLLIRFIGFKEARYSIPTGRTEIDFAITLIEAINELEAVTITAGAFAASDENRRTVFRAVDIATTAGATADIAGALNTLPGTQKVGETGRLFVRGGDGTEARTFIDGMVVMDPYGPAAPQTPSRGRFLPFMFKGTSFSTGGYSAEYGQALSSALVLESKDESEATRTDLGIMSVGGDVTHTQAWPSGSWAAKVQYTNLQPYFSLVNQYLDWITPPRAMEGSTAFRQKVGNEGMVKLFGNYNSSSLSLYQTTVGDDQRYVYSVDNNYGYLNGFYREALSDQWMVRGGASYTYSNTTTQVSARETSEANTALHGKVAFEGSLSDRINVVSGAEVLQRTHSPEGLPGEGFTEWIPSVFAEADFYASNKLVSRVGLRSEYNSLTRSASLDPRVSIAYKPGDKGTLAMAYGNFRQSQAVEYLRMNTQLASANATHYILSYQHVDNQRTFRTEMYYKTYDRLVKYAGTTPDDVNTNGYGYARGIDVFWRDNRTLKNVDYWVSYSFLDTERDYLDAPNATTPSFASAHNFSIVYKHFVSALQTQFGATYSFTSGRPYNDPNDEVCNGSRTPAYHDLSVNISYLPKPWLIVYFSCTNVTGRDNIFGYEFSDLPDGQGLYAGRPIMQPAKRFLFLGIFITISKNKSINQLPTL